MRQYNWTNVAVVYDRDDAYTSADSKCKFALTTLLFAKGQSLDIKSYSYIFFLVLIVSE